MDAAGRDEDCNPETKAETPLADDELDLDGHI